jgi:GNAT superfamily N-acetyltransferase
VRRATAQDGEAIAEIIEELIESGERVALGPMSPYDIRVWIDRQGEDGVMLVVDDGRFILGFAAVDFDSAAPQECTYGAWVRPLNRRQGHGTALAEEAIAFARERGYRRVRGRLPEGNEPALSYLSSIGALVPMQNPGMAFELPIYGEE